MSNTRFIGITGGVGAGKSEILKYIAEHFYCKIYLADEVAHEVKKAGTACFDALVALLGEEVVAADGEIDKKKMAELIFADEALLKQVNDIVHPAVREYIVARMEEAKEDPEVDLFFVEAALLIEAGYKELLDELWYIYASGKVRRARLKAARGYSDEKIRQIMASQLTEKAFRESCDFVINNSGELESAQRQIDRRLRASRRKETEGGNTL